MSDTKRNTSALSTIDSFKVDLAKTHQKAIENFFAGDHDKAMRFMSAVMHSVTKTPKLLECKRDTLINAFMACAEFQLYPSDVSGEAYVLPYKDKAQFQLGYQGILTLLYRAGNEGVHADIVYENDEFDYTSGMEPKLYHKPKIFGDRGKPIGVYAVATPKGGKPMFKVMSKEDVMKFREFSQSKGSEYSPWNPKNDPELHMWRKTAIKQLAKVLPKNETIFKAIDTDNQDSRIKKVEAMVEHNNLKMGAFLKEQNNGENETKEGSATEVSDPESGEPEIQIGE